MSNVATKNAPKSGRKKKVTLVTAGLLAVGVGAAIAYWTVGGTGTGEAATGDSEDVAVVQTTDVTPMYPGDEAQALEGNFNNPNAGPAYVGTVTVTIDSVDDSDGEPAASCSEADYTLTGAEMPVGVDVPAGTSQGAWAGASIQFNNTEENQDGCKNATVNLAYTVGS